MGEIIEFKALQRAEVEKAVNSALAGLPAESVARIRNVVLTKVDGWDKAFSFRFELDLPSNTAQAEIQKIHDNFQRLLSSVRDLALENIELTLKLMNNEE